MIAPLGNWRYVSILLLLVLLVVVAGVLSTKTQSLAKSSEAGFISLSPRGLEGGAIIPASCESGLGEGGIAHFAGDTSGTCFASVNPPISPTLTAVNGACDTSGAVACSAGTVQLTGARSWQCLGVNGGTSASCTLPSTDTFCTISTFTQECSIGGNGIPAGQTSGTGLFAGDNCGGPISYISGCSAPVTNPPVTNPPACPDITFSQPCSIAPANGIPAGQTVGTALFTQNTCTNVFTYVSGCSAPVLPAMVTWLGSHGCVLASDGTGCNINATWVASNIPPGTTVDLNVANPTLPGGGTTYAGLPADPTQIIHVSTAGAYSFKLLDTASQVQLGQTLAMAVCPPGFTIDPVTQLCVAPVGAAATLTAKPNPVDYNGRSTLTWTSSNATSCIAGGPWSNLTPPSGDALNGSGLTDPLLSPTTFSLSCTGPLGAAPVQSVMVTVAAPVCSNGTINPLQCDQCPSNLVYDAVHDVCVACVGGCTSVTGVIGGTKTNPLGDPPLLCNNGNFNPPECDAAATAVTFTANPTTVDSGQSSLLSWASNNIANTCIIPTLGSGGFTGSISTGPLTQTSSFSVTCSGPGGVAASGLTIPVRQPDAHISANPLRVTAGGATTVSWTAANADSCSITKNGAPWRPTLTLVGNTADTGLTVQTEYTLVCRNGFGAQAKDSVIVNIVPVFTNF